MSDRAFNKYVQGLLQTAGFSPGTVDGKVGTKTRSAIMLFQRKAGLKQTGMVDPDTLNALKAGKVSAIPTPKKRPYGAPDFGPRIPGMVEQGNINLNARPLYRNPDGTISTEKSMSFGRDGREVLIPTVAADGSRILPDSEAIDQYDKSGQMLGAFADPAAADRYAQALHVRQEGRYGGLGRVPDNVGVSMPAAPPPPPEVSAGAGAALPPQPTQFGPGGAPLAPETGMRGLLEMIPGYRGLAKPPPVLPGSGNSPLAAGGAESYDPAAPYLPPQTVPKPPGFDAAFDPSPTGGVPSFADAFAPPTSKEDALRKQLMRAMILQNITQAGF